MRRTRIQKGARPLSVGDALTRARFMAAGLAAAALLATGCASSSQATNTGISPDTGVSADVNPDQPRDTMMARRPDAAPMPPSMPDTMAPMSPPGVPSVPDTIARADTAGVMPQPDVMRQPGVVQREAAGVLGVDAAAMFAGPNIAAVSAASNRVEIETSRIAVERASDDRVRQFAQRMIDEHQRLDQEMQQLLQQQGVRPQDNALSVQLERNIQPMLDSLRAQQGAAFDRAYLLQQISAHELTLNTLETSLIPSAQDAQLRQMLEQHVRPAVAEHLRQAKELEKSMRDVPSPRPHGERGW